MVFWILVLAFTVALNRQTPLKMLATDAKNTENVTPDPIYLEWTNVLEAVCP